MELEGLEPPCSCCLQLFAEPVRLPGCGHSFCRGCVLRYCAGRPRAPCPRCAFEPQQLRPNRELAALLSLIPRELKEESETQEEPGAHGAAACNGLSSAGRGRGEKEEEIWESSKQQEIAAETIHLLKTDLNKTRNIHLRSKARLLKISVA